jgi:hypothetical protein
MTTHAVHEAEIAASPWVNSWAWDKPRSPEHFRCCNFCGSIHPEDLAAEPNWTAQWADRKYGWPHKFYVDIPDRDGKPDWLGGSNRDMTDEELARYGWKRVSELTRKERKILKRLGHDLKGPHADKVVGLGPRDVHHAKFYTEHFADPNISAVLIDRIQRRSGLLFEWHDDGNVSWRPVAP